jgi:hypothetical protein
MPIPKSAMAEKTPQQMLQDFIEKGGKVIVCLMCLKHAGFSPTDLIDDLLVGKAEVTLPALYGSSKVLSY